VKDAIENIEGTKQQRFGAPDPFCKDHLLTVTFRIRSQKLGRPSRCVFSIGVHHEDRVAAQTFLNVCEPNGNRSLDAKVSAQSQKLYSPDYGEVALEVTVVALLY
jgi:hypothetical protein